MGPWGDVALTGFFEGTAQFGGSPLTSAGGRDAYLAIYNTAGVYLESRAYGDATNQYGEDVAYDNSGAAFVTGGFNGSINFGNGPLISAGGYDVFLAKLGAPDSGMGEILAGERPRLHLPPVSLDDVTTLHYTLPRAGWVRLSVFDTGGRCLETLVDHFAAAGEHDVVWQSGEGPAGVRLVRMATGGYQNVGKILLVK